MRLRHVLFAMLVPATLPAQQPRRPLRIADSTAVAIVRSARAEGLRGAPWLIDILRQRDGAQSIAKLNAVADSLTNDIIAASPRSLDGLNLASAVSLLISAGSPGDIPGVPYQGAMDRLIQIHREASGSVRGATLGMILSVAGDRQRGLAYLRSVAESLTDPTAPQAVYALNTEVLTGGLARNPQLMRDEAERVLKAMWDVKSIRNASAVEALGRFASMRGWK